MAEYFTCEVNQAGPDEDGRIWIQLTHVDGEFPARWFIADFSMKNEILATALVAIANRLNAWVELSSTDEEATVLELYVRRGD